MKDHNLMFVPSVCQLSQQIGSSTATLCTNKQFMLEHENQKSMSTTSKYESCCTIIEQYHGEYVYLRGSEFKIRAETFKQKRGNFKLHSTFKYNF